MSDRSGSADEMQMATNGLFHNSGIVIVTPTYNDWVSLLALLPKIDATLRSIGAFASVIAVDDGSTVGPEGKAVEALALTQIEAVDVLVLHGNLGNQRAVATGISYIAAEVPCDYLIVMDSDHEDEPSDIPALLKECRVARTITFAERSRRSEGLVFTASYRIYQIIFRFLVGFPISVGNFSVIPGPLVRRIANISGIWTHYSSAIMRERLPIRKIPTVRGKRHVGRSSMSMVFLVIHGFSALAVHADTVAARALIIAIVFFLTTATAVIGVVGLAPIWDVPISDGALLVFITLLVVFAQFSVVAFVLFLVTLGTKYSQPIIPARDFRVFVNNVQPLASHARNRNF